MLKKLKKNVAKLNSKIGIIAIGFVLLVSFIGIGSLFASDNTIYSLSDNIDSRLVLTDTAAVEPGSVAAQSNSKIIVDDVADLSDGNNIGEVKPYMYEENYVQFLVNNETTSTFWSGSSDSNSVEIVQPELKKDENGNAVDANGNEINLVNPTERGTKLNNVVVENEDDVKYSTGVGEGWMCNVQDPHINRDYVGDWCYFYPIVTEDSGVDGYGKGEFGLTLNNAGYYVDDSGNLQTLNLRMTVTDYELIDNMDPEYLDYIKNDPTGSTSYNLNPNIRVLASRPNDNFFSQTEGQETYTDYSDDAYELTGSDYTRNRVFFLETSGIRNVEYDFSFFYTDSSGKEVPIKDKAAFTLSDIDNSGGFSVNQSQIDHVYMPICTIGGPDQYQDVPVDAAPYYAGEVPANMCSQFDYKKYFGVSGVPGTDLSKMPNEVSTDVKNNYGISPATSVLGQSEDLNGNPINPQSKYERMHVYDSTQYLTIFDAWGIDSGSNRTAPRNFYNEGGGNFGNESDIELHFNDASSFTFSSMKGEEWLGADYSTINTNYQAGVSPFSGEDYRVETLAAPTVVVEKSNYDKGYSDDGKTVGVDDGKVVPGEQITYDLATFNLGGVELPQEIGVTITDTIPDTLTSVDGTTKVYIADSKLTDELAQMKANGEDLPTIEKLLADPDKGAYYATLISLAPANAYTDNSTATEINIDYLDAVAANNTIIVEFTTVANDDLSSAVENKGEITNTACTKLTVEETEVDHCDDSTVVTTNIDLDAEKAATQVSGNDNEYIAQGEVWQYEIKTINAGTASTKYDGTTGKANGDASNVHIVDGGSDFPEELTIDADSFEVIKLDSAGKETVLKAGTDYTDDSNLETNNIDITVNTIKIDEQVIIRFNVSVEEFSDAVYDKTITSFKNTATITPSDSDLCEADDGTLKACDPLTPSEEILPEFTNVTIEKNLKQDKGIDGEGVDDQIAQKGEELVYNLTVKNDGAVAASDVVVTDTLPKSLQLLQVDSVTSSNGEVDYEDKSSDSKVLLTLNTVEAGDVITITYTTKVVSIDEDKITNVVTIEDPNNPLCNPEPQNCEDDHTIVPGAPQIAITKTLKTDKGVDGEGVDGEGVDDKTAQINEQLDYQLAVVNGGNSSASNVVVTDELPAQLELIKIESVTNLAGENVVYEDNTSGNNINLTIAKIPVGEQVIITYSTKVVDVNSGDIENTAKVTDPANPSCDPDPSACESEEVVPPASSHIIIDKSIINEFNDDGSDTKDDIAQQDEKLTYQLTVTNDSDIAGFNIIVSDEIPEQLKYIKLVDVVDAETGEEVEFENQSKGTLLKLQIAKIKAGQSINITYNAQVIDTSSGDIKNTANVVDPSNESCEPDPSDCEDDAVIPPAGPAVITATKGLYNLDNSQVLTGQTLQAGASYYYQITVKNSGDDQAKDVIVNDQIPEVYKLALADDALSVVDSEGKKLVLNTDYLNDGTDLSTGLINVSINKIAVDSQVSVRIKVTVAPDLNGVTETEVTNTATIDSPYCEDDSATLIDDCNPSETNNLPGLDLSLTKTVNDNDGDSKVSPGEVVNYSLVVKSSSDSITTTGVTVSDDITDPNLDASTITDITVTDKNAKVLEEGSDYQVEVSDGLKITFLTAINGGDTFTISFKITSVSDYNLDETTLIKNTATVSDPEGRDTDPSNDSDDAQIPISTPAINITKLIVNEDNLIENNEEFAYTLVLSNNSEVEAKDVTVNDDISSVKGLNKEIISIEIDKKDGYTDNSDLANGLVDITFDKLSAGEVVKITVNVSASKDSSENETILNKATISADACDNPLSICSSEQETNTAAPELSAEKFVTDSDNDSQAAKSEYLTYEIVVTNSGSVAAKDVKVSDNLSAEELDSTTQRNLKVDGVAVEGLITEGILIDVPANSSVTVSFEVRVIKVTKDQNIINIANVVDPNDPDNPLTPQSTIPPYIPGTPVQPQDEDQAKVEEEEKQKEQNPIQAIINTTGFNYFVSFIIILSIMILAIVFIRRRKNNK